MGRPAPNIFDRGGRRQWAFITKGDALGRRGAQEAPTEPESSCGGDPEPPESPREATASAQADPEGSGGSQAPQKASDGA